MFTSYAVVIEQYAERHFISSFKKKHKGAWDVTWVGMHEEFKRIDALIGQTNIVETITEVGDVDKSILLLYSSSRIVYDARPSLVHNKHHVQ